MEKFPNLPTNSNYKEYQHWMQQKIYSHNPRKVEINTIVPEKVEIIHHIDNCYESVVNKISRPNSSINLVMTNITKYKKYEYLLSR